jgi:hypothetical protein
MIKVKDVSEALAGDFISYKQKLSVISSVSYHRDLFVLQLEDGTEIECLPSMRFEIFRIINRDKSTC